MRKYREITASPADGQYLHMVRCDDSLNKNVYTYNTTSGFLKYYIFLNNEIEMLIR